MFRGTRAPLISSSLPQPCAQHSSPTNRALDSPSRPRSLFALLSPRQPLRMCPACGQLCDTDPQFTVVQGEDTAHAVQEATYAYVGWIFAQHFCNRLGSAYLALKNGESDPLMAGSLANL